MTTESIMFRLRRANPVPQAPAGDQADLFARIISSPGDSRLAGRVRQRPLGNRRRALVVAFALGVAALLASTAFAVSHWITGDVVRPPVTKREYRDAQAQLTLPPGVTWPQFHITEPNSVTSRGGGGARAVGIAQNAWECYWVRAINRGDGAAEQRAYDQLKGLLANNVIVAPIGAPEGWTPLPLPKYPISVWAHDGGLNYVRDMYARAAAGDSHDLAQSCRVNAP